MNDKRDDIYKALADGHRRQILALLCQGSRRAGELGRQVGLAPNAVSFHLRWLRSSGLVSVDRDGRFLWYRVEPTTVAAWQTEVRQQFETSTKTSGAEDQTGRFVVKRRPARKIPKHGVRHKRERRPTPRPSRPRKSRSEDIAVDILPTELL